MGNKYILLTNKKQNLLCRYSTENIATVGGKVSLNTVPLAEENQFKHLVEIQNDQNDANGFCTESEKQCERNMNFITITWRPFFHACMAQTEFVEVGFMQPGTLPVTNSHLFPNKMTSPYNQTCFLQIINEHRLCDSYAPECTQNTCNRFVFSFCLTKL